jgi:hypothetical protein
MQKKTRIWLPLVFSFLTGACGKTAPQTLIHGEWISLYDLEADSLSKAKDAQYETLADRIAAYVKATSKSSEAPREFLRLKVNNGSFEMIYQRNRCQDVMTGTATVIEDRFEFKIKESTQGCGEDVSYRAGSVLRGEFKVEGNRLALREDDNELTVFDRVESSDVVISRLAGKWSYSEKAPYTSRENSVTLQFDPTNDKLNLLMMESHSSQVDYLTVKTNHLHSSIGENRINFKAASLDERIKHLDGQGKFKSWEFRKKGPLEASFTGMDMNLLHDGRLLIVMRSSAGSVEFVPMFLKRDSGKKSGTPTTTPTVVSPSGIKPGEGLPKNSPYFPPSVTLKTNRSN